MARKRIGDHVREYQKKKAEKKAKDRLKKFPSIALANRPLPVQRHGTIMPEERQIIELMLRDQPQELSSEQITALSSLLRRNEKTVRNLVLKARDRFTENGTFYVEAHAKAVGAALASGEFDTAAKHAEWAIENLEMEGGRIIDREVKGAGSNVPQVMIGVNLGGVPTPEIVK